MKVKNLNIGCGANYHEKWINIDIYSTSRHVRACDIRNGLPFENESIDAVYCSHVLEHLTMLQAKKLLKEIFRVLKYGSVARIIVPDLEQIVRLYLQKLDDAANNISGAEADYDWMMLELYDQTVRTSGGGEMLHYLTDKNIRNKKFVLSRIGKEAEIFFPENALTPVIPNTTWVNNFKKMWDMNKCRSAIAGMLVKLMVGSRAIEALNEGIFRNSGEIHRWMYDRFSLGRLMRNTGFQNIHACQADESRIVNFSSFELDMVKGKIRKPDSLFMEGLKP